jgi:hypothetical protein
MKLEQILNNIDPTKISNDYGFGDDLFDNLQLDGSYWGDYNMDEIESHLKDHYIVKWMCTDTIVGMCIHFIDDKPFAVSKQAGRKSDIIFRFLSKELYHEVRNLFIKNRNNNFVDHISLIDLENDIDDTYQIGFTSQLLREHEYAYYKDKLVKIDFNATMAHTKGQDYSMSNFVAVNIDGNLGHVSLNDLTFPLNLIK